MKNIRNYSLSLLVLAAVLLTATTYAADTYINTKNFQYTEIIADPPSPNSSEGQAEFTAMLELQQHRTSSDVKRLKWEDVAGNHAFDDILGSWFTEKQLPLTMKLMKNVVKDVEAVTDRAKAHWDRPRPYVQDREIKPCVGLPGNQSYPSGHSTGATARALLLVELCPDLKEKILARGVQIGDDRVFAGVHFPSDVMAGRTLSRAIFKQISATPQFQADLTAAKAEVDRARDRN